MPIQIPKMIRTPLPTEVGTVIRVHVDESVTPRRKKWFAVKLPPLGSVDDAWLVASNSTSHGATWVGSCEITEWWPLDGGES